MVGDYAYLNSRVRAWKSRLFTRGMYEDLVGKPDLFSIGLSLQKTQYGPDLEEVIGRSEVGADDYDRGIRRHLSRFWTRLHAMSGENAQSLIDIILSRWDLHNIKTVLRGKHSRTAPESIMVNFIPGGILKEPLLKELANALDVGGVVDLLSTWRIDLAKPLRPVLETYQRTLEPRVLEVALNQHYYRGVFLKLGKETDPNAGMVLEMIRREIDVINIKSALNLLGEPVPSGEEGEYFLTGGRDVDFPRFLSLIKSTDMETFINALAGTRFGRNLEAMALQRKTTDPLIAEGLLDHFLVTEGASWFLEDPLGIGIILGFHWMKYAEVVNLRLILQGKGIGIPEEDIRKEMIFV